MLNQSSPCHSCSDIEEEFCRKLLEKGGRKYYPEKEIAKLLGISTDQLRKKLNSSKPLTRDWLIAICAVHGMGANETSSALLQAGISSLDPGLARDEFISDFLDNHVCKYEDRDGKYSCGKVSSYRLTSLEKFNDALFSAGFPPLNINRRKGRTTQLDEPMNSKYKASNKTIVQIFGADGDPYGCMDTEYLPGLYCAAITVVEDTQKQRYKLRAFSDGKCEMYDRQEILPHEFMSWEDTGELKPFFYRLLHEAQKEKRRLDDTLNDTRNYQTRFSANLKDDQIHLFYEEYNYAMPERNEYYLMEYVNGRYLFSISHDSMFMEEYLSEQEYAEHYAGKKRSQRRIFNSAEEAAHPVNHSRECWDYLDLGEHRKRKFIKLEGILSERLEEFRQGKIFVRQSDVFENRYDIIRYFDMEKEFECQYDKIYGDICNARDSVMYSYSGNRIEVQFSDLRRAFELGFHDIDQICRVKNRYGSVEAVLR